MPKLETCEVCGSSDSQDWTRPDRTVPPWSSSSGPGRFSNSDLCDVRRSLLVRREGYKKILILQKPAFLTYMMQAVEES